jgi:hypothetical protein
MALLTGFTSNVDWNSTTGYWGVAGNLQGTIYAYAGPKSGTWQASVDATAGVLDIGVQTGATVGTGTVAAGDYAGGGLTFSQCVNTNSWTGVEFTLGGSAAGCDVIFQVKTFAEQAISTGGGCDAGCYVFPDIKVQIGAQPITVHFSDLAGGKPVGGAAIAMQIVGLEWQLQSNGGTQLPCTGAELTVDNVRFVNN